MADTEVPKKRTRIQARNEARILAAALNVFSTNGYRGTTVDQIAVRAGMSKANVLYYFKKKHDIYAAVLTRTLSLWLGPLSDISAEGDPIEELWWYAQKKLRLSRESPNASRLFANEILQGAQTIGPYLDHELKQLVTDKCITIQEWIDAGKLAAISPLHLIFFIWSTTQHYADFEAQIQVLHGADENVLFQDAEATLKLILTNGLAP